VTGDQFLAKIAVKLERALARRAATGEPGRTVGQAVAGGDGWTVSDVVCSCGPQDRPFEEQHSRISIAIVLAGCFRYRSESAGKASSELMTPGSLFLGNSSQYFECGHEHGAGDRCLSFQYSTDYFERLAAEAGVRGGGKFRRLRIPAVRDLSPTVTRACAALTTLEDGGQPCAPWEELSVQLAAEALQVANGLSPDRGDSTQPSALARVARAVRMIEEGSGSELALGTLARGAGLSPYHFLRTFQKLTGVTPHQYLRRIRLREAAIRLATEPAKVLDIAFDCGFGDVSNFNRAFRSEFGASPLAYRMRAKLRGRTPASQPPVT
jgi:AraC family transcriptional regulator